MVPSSSTTTSIYSSTGVPFLRSLAPNQDRLLPYPITTNSAVGPPAHIPDYSAAPPSVASSAAADRQNHIPGDAAVGLSPSEVDGHFMTQLATPLLDELHDKLWMVAKRTGRNVDALHVQTIKGRCIVPAEDPKLHLVWDRDKIYIKPMPEFLLNHDFWCRYLGAGADATQVGPDKTDAPPAPDRRSLAMGFLRSYALLVPQRVDFMLATKSHLLPAEMDWITWSRFIKHFRCVSDEAVAKRYHYGQLRISRLNLVVRLFRPSSAAAGVGSAALFYQIPHWSTAAFVSRATLPLAFIFASVSVVLSSMQLLLAVQDSGLSPASQRRMRQAFWVFALAMLMLLVVSYVLLLGVPLGIWAWQMQWGFRRRKDCSEKNP